jgi:hypothetical protein
MRNSDEKSRQARTGGHRARPRPRRPARSAGAGRRRAANRPKKNLATLVVQALEANPSLHGYDRYLAVLLDGLPAYKPVTGVRDGSLVYGPLLPVMPGTRPRA